MNPTIYKKPTGNKSMRSDTSQPRPTDRKEVVLRLKEIAKHSKNLAGELLVLLDDVGFWLSIAHKYPNLVGDPFAGEIIAEIDGAKERKKVQDAVGRIKKQKLVTDRKYGNQICRNLTKKGSIRALEYRIRSNDELLSEGSFTMATFDVPENSKLTRQFIRKKLKQLGFEQYQLSVWVSRFDVFEEMEQYIREINAEKWVTIFRAVGY